MTRRTRRSKETPRRAGLASLIKEHREQATKTFTTALAKDLAEQATDDAVNHPGHYGGASNPYETIKVMEATLTSEELIGALKFQVYKYTDRHRAKGGFEDLRKAKWYLDRLVSYIESRGLAAAVGPNASPAN